MKTIVIKVRPVVRGVAEGEAVVTKDPISFMGGVDVYKGTITEKGHEIEGVSIAGKILVFPHGKGSTGGSYMLYEMAECGKAPKAIVALRADPIVAAGAVLAGIPMVDRPDVDPLRVIDTGDYVVVDASKGLVKVFKVKGK